MNTDRTIDLNNGLIEYIEYHYYTKLNNEWHGECSHYYLSGELCYHAYYKNNKQEGEFLIYKL